MPRRYSAVEQQYRPLAALGIRFVRFPAQPTAAAAAAVQRGLSDGAGLCPPPSSVAPAERGLFVGQIPRGLPPAHLAFAVNTIVSSDANSDGRDSVVCSVFVARKQACGWIALRADDAIRALRMTETALIETGGLWLASNAEEATILNNFCRELRDHRHGEELLQLQLPKSTFTMKPAKASTTPTDDGSSAGMAQEQPRQQQQQQSDVFETAPSSATATVRADSTISVAETVDDDRSILLKLNNNMTVVENLPRDAISSAAEPWSWSFPSPATQPAAEEVPPPTSDQVHQRWPPSSDRGNRRAPPLTDYPQHHHQRAPPPVTPQPKPTLGPLSSMPMVMTDTTFLAPYRAPSQHDARPNVHDTTVRPSQPPLQRQSYAPAAVAMPVATALAQPRQQQQRPSAFVQHPGSAALPPRVPDRFVLIPVPTVDAFGRPVLLPPQPPQPTANNTVTVSSSSSSPWPSNVAGWPHLLYSPPPALSPTASNGGGGCVYQVASRT